MSIVDLNFTAIAPLLTVAVTALLVLALDLTLPAGRSRPWWYAVSAAGIVLALGYTASLWSSVGNLGGQEVVSISSGIAVFGEAFIVDRFSLIFSAIILVAALLSVMMSVRRTEEDLSAYIALILWSALGMMVMAGAANFLVLFLGLEILSLSLYVAVAFGEGDDRGKEGAFKYLILGSLASGAMLYGAALLYAQTGSLYLTGLAQGWAADSGALMQVGFGLVVFGFAFKLALAPFHIWAPDVYEGASAPVTAFMSVGTKAAAFAALVRFLVATLPGDSSALMTPLWALAVVSMVVGSLGACVQNNVKRILAYSSVAHVGYLMMALLGMTERGVSAGAFYLAAYLFVNVGAFAVVVWLGKNGREGETLEDFAGLIYRRPVLALSMSLFLLSLAGFPPAGGFPGKLFLIFAALDSGAGAPATWLVAALVATTAISAYAYLRIVTRMFRRETADVASVGIVEAAAAGDDDAPRSAEAPFAWALAFVVGVAVAGTLYMGVVPQSALSLAERLLPLS